MLRDYYCFNSCPRLLGKRQGIKSLVARTAGRIFGAVAGSGLRIDAPHLQRHTEALAQLHAMPLEVVRRRLQAVVDMPGMHLTGPALRACQQQRRRIRTAAERHRQRQRRRPGSKRGHRAFHRLGGAAGRW